MCSSLLWPDQPLYQRFEGVIQTWKNLSGGGHVGFNNSVYLSEKDTAHRNFCLGHMMMEAGAFPPGTDLKKTLSLYFMTCSIELNLENLAISGAVFANNGISVLTGEKIFSPETVKNALSLMLSCGLYDASGLWAFSIGLPAKSGVSGCIFVVVPNLGCFATFSPRLDEAGNSVKGVKFFEKLIERYSLHVFDDTSKLRGGNKIDPKRRFFASNCKRELLFSALFASAEGDLYELQKVFSSGGLDANLADYDGRTCLHLAVCGGHVRTCDFLLRVGASASVKDRWNMSPLDYAVNSGNVVLMRMMGHSSRE
eukprot:TRINITY_DN2082_c0_g1_i2.p1 TRINITY_DN2082_c0_g1~~TRINITY_DN2082_c0_g1_i2.p1  ORF type:complete len:311 (+),score=44.51 TRINITY_DN2082_c0_g1_i2:960-1892(+)